MMVYPVLDHFVYTTAKTNSKTGYQVVAKSKGVDDALLNKMSNYLYPLGVNTMEFTKSKSLLPIGKTHIAYSVVKNIGVGHDGRNGTLYNHTIILKKEDFEKIEYDTRILDNYFIEEYNIRGTLDQLHIKPEKLKFDFEYLKMLDNDLLRVLLFYLFKDSKIAIINTMDERLIQNMLAVLPPQIRFIPFSTLVLDPTRQTKYRLIQIPKKTQSKLTANYISINQNTLSSLRIERAQYMGIQNVIDLIRQGNQTQLLKFHKDFKKITMQVSQIKRTQIDDIFNSEKFEKLAKNKKFSQMLEYVNTIYSSSSLNQASPIKILKITKKIRKIIKKSLLTINLEKIDLEKLMSIFKILFSCLNYIDQLSEKKMGNTTRSGIKQEIGNIGEILEQYPETEPATQSYELNPYNYFNTFCASMIGLTYSVALFFLNRK